MKKIERRAVLCLVLAGLLLAGLALFLFRFFSDGGHWASSPFNRHLYNSAGQLISGTLLDRDGEVLSAVDQSGSRTYPDGETRRKSILHVVGDPYGSIGTGALTAFATASPALTCSTAPSGPSGAIRYTSPSMRT